MENKTQRIHHLHSGSTYLLRAPIHAKEYFNKDNRIVLNLIVSGSFLPIKSNLMRRFWLITFNRNISFKFTTDGGRI